MRSLTYGGLAFGFVAVMAFAGCGGKVEVDNGGEGGSGAGSGTSSGQSSSGSQTGGGGNLPGCAVGKTTVLAMDRLLLGDTNPDGTLNSTKGWKQYGLNLDGRISTKESTDVCKPNSGALPAAAYPDGDEGRDNSFGKNVLPMLLGLSPEWSGWTNEAMANGAFTYLLSIEDPGPNAACTTTSKLFGGRSLGYPPHHDGSDVWPIDPASLDDQSDPSSSKNVFLTSTIQAEAYDSGPEATFNLTIGVNSTYTLRLPIRHARFVMDFEPDHAGAIHGQIGGVLDTDEFSKAIAELVAQYDPIFCSPTSPTLLSILNQLRQASDIMTDGTQDPSQVCNGISIGIGFTMKAATLGSVAKPEPPPPNPCN